MLRRTTVVATAAVLAAPALAMAHPGHEDPPPFEGSSFVFNGEGNRLSVYDAANGAKRTLIDADADADTGAERDINAQICFHDVDGTTYFIAGEDTRQGSQSTTDPGKAGWGWFRLTGDSLTTLDADQQGKLVPAFTGGDANKNENYGCAFLDDGRLLLTDVGDQQFQGAGNGQLHIWFPDSGGGFGAGYGETILGDGQEVPTPSSIDYCLIDNSIATAGGIAVDGNSALVASARPAFDGQVRPWGVLRYDNLPTSVDDCSEPDEDGVRHAEGVLQTPFIVDPANVPTPNAIVPSGEGTWYVSSVFNGVIAEYSRQGIFMRRLLAPPVDEMASALPMSALPYYSTGTPLGIGVTPDGRVWYADIGIDVVNPQNIGPSVPGTVRYVDPSTDDGNPLTPLTPTTIDTDLAFPDGIGVLNIPAPAAP